MDVGVVVASQRVDDGATGCGVDGEDLAARSVRVLVVELEVRTAGSGEAKRGDALVLRQRGGAVVEGRQASAIGVAADHVHARSRVAQLSNRDRGAALHVGGDVEDRRRCPAAVGRAVGVVDAARRVSDGLALAGQVRQKLGAQVLVHQREHAVGRELALVSAEEVRGPLGELGAGDAVAVEDAVGARARRLVGDECAVLLVGRVAVVGRGGGLDGHSALRAPDAGQLRVRAHLRLVVGCRGSRGGDGRDGGGSAHFGLDGAQLALQLVDAELHFQHGEAVVELVGVRPRLEFGEVVLGVTELLLDLVAARRDGVDGAGGGGQAVVLGRAHTGIAVEADGGVVQGGGDAGASGQAGVLGRANTGSAVDGVGGVVQGGWGAGGGGAIDCE